MNTYNEIWEQICKKRGLTTDADKARYLESLKPVAEKLWSGYRTSAVTIDYNDTGIQDVYLLRYAPHYKEILEVILRNIDTSFLSAAKNVVCLAPGCGPEVYGLYKSCQTKNISFSPDQVTYVDYFDWSHAIDVMKTSTESVFGVTIPLQRKNVNLNVHSSLFTHRDLIYQADVVTMQNCLNEVIRRDSSRLVTSILGYMKPGAHLIISDLSQYETSAYTINGSYSSIVKKSKKVISCYLVNHEMPSVISENLLTRENGLIPRSKMKISYMILRK